MHRIINLQKDLIQITIALSLFAFASSMVGVFIPLVILKSGGRLWEVAVFYLIYAVVKLIINFPVVLMIQKKGVHFGLGWAFLAGAMQMLSILEYASTRNVWLLVIGAASLSLTNAFLWSSQHLFISSVVEDDTKSSSLATMGIIGQIAGVAAPLVGGLIGAYLGSYYLLGSAVFLCAIAFISLKGISKQVHASRSNDEKIRYSFKGAPIGDIIANFSYNTETMISIMVWPIYLAVFVASYRNIGAIITLAAAVSIVVTWIAGRRGDRGQDRAVLREGVAITSIIDLFRLIASTQIWITVITTGYRASLSYLQNAWTSTYYFHAKRKGLQYIVRMEMACDLAYASIWAVLLATLLLSSSSRVFFVTAFIIAAVFIWGCLLMGKQVEVKPNPSIIKSDI